MKCIVLCRCWRQSSRETCARTSRSAGWLHGASLTRGAIEWRQLEENRSGYGYQLAGTGWEQENKRSVSGRTCSRPDSRSASVGKFWRVASGCIPSRSSTSQGRLEWAGITAWWTGNKRSEVIGLTDLCQSLGLWYHYLVVAGCQKQRWSGRLRRLLLTFPHNQKPRTYECSSMHFAWNCFLSFQVFWNSFELANRGISDSLSSISFTSPRKGRPEKLGTLKSDMVSYFLLPRKTQDRNRLGH